MEQTQIVQAQLIPLTPYHAGIDQKSPITFLPEGKVSKAKNVWFERGVVRQRRGYPMRIYRNSGTGLLIPSAISPSSNPPMLGFARLWAADAAGTEQELWFDNKTASTYSFATGTLTSLFITTSTDHNCFLGGGKLKPI